MGQDENFHCMPDSALKKPEMALAKIVMEHRDGDIVAINIVKGDVHIRVGMNTKDFASAVLCGTAVDVEVLRWVGVKS